MTAAVRPRQPVVLLLAAWLVSGAAAQQADDVDGDLARVLIYSPAAGKPVLGGVTFRADVFSSYDVKEVRLRVDGEEVITFLAPPYELPLELGDDNVEHRFEVVVLGYDRELGRASRVTPAIHTVSFCCTREPAVPIEYSVVTSPPGERRFTSIPFGSGIGLEGPPKSVVMKSPVLGSSSMPFSSSSGLPVPA